MGLPAGNLNRRIAIMRHGRTYDDMKRPTEGWSQLTSVAASWRRASANERLASSQVGAQVTDIFEIKYSSVVASIDPRDRVVYRGKDYDIAEVTEIGAREGLLIRATARVDERP